jgi:hypothetical protein
VRSELGKSLALILMRGCTHEGGYAGTKAHRIPAGGGCSDLGRMVALAELMNGHR